MFLNKYYKGSINDIISKFEAAQKSIIETYNIGFDSKKNKASSVETQSVVLETIKKYKGYIINFILLGSIVLLALPIIVINFNNII